MPTLPTFRFLRFALLSCLWLAACAAPVPSAPAQIDPPFPAAGPVGTTAKVYPLESGWHNGQAVRYYNFGQNTPLSADDPTRVLSAPGWLFITGMNADGSPNKFKGQATVFPVKPSDKDYSDLWQISVVIPPADYMADNIKDAEAVQASGFTIEKTPMLVNCPIVPAGSSLADKAIELGRSWVKGQEFAYFDFGPTSAKPGKLYAFVTGLDANGQPQLVPGQHFVFSAKRGEAGYSDFWRVYWVIVAAGYTPDTLKAEADIPVAQITESNWVVNYPQK